jgi:ketosteroid isomerase-like protein
MTSNKDIIQKFYTAFQQKDYKTMQDCYASDAVFSDEVFKDLNAAQVKAMWQMLLTSAKDFTLEFKNVQANDTTGSAEWIATYTFSATNRKVINRIKAGFTFENGKIVQHTDRFSFYAWAKQALGTPGLLLGWTGSLKKKVQQKAMKNLEGFMQKNKI